MKLSDILLLTLFFVMGAMIFAIKQKQKALGNDGPSVPVPVVKPAPPQIAAVPELRLQLSTPETAGSYGRLSLDQFLARSEPEVTLRQTAPKAAAERTPNTAPLRPVQRPTPNIAIKPIKIETADPVSLPSLPLREEAMFMDRIAQMAEASPVQPSARDCGSLNSNIKSTTKAAKARSVAMQRQLTDRTSIGVEYVYKDGCYKNAIAPLRSLEMPSDDGVNLRVNMRF